jgi:Holliday junction DNA helicase RuvB
MATGESQFRALNRPEEWDAQLRPRSLDEFVGQGRVVENLRIALQAAHLRGEPLEHILLSGLPGLGKTTLCSLLARETSSQLTTSSGPALVRPADLAGVLTSLERGDVLFIDEVHRLPPTVEEFLYSAMEDFVIDVPIDQGVGSRSVRLQLQPFTLVGATTREGRLTPPFRGRFGIREKLAPYPVNDLITILQRTARLLQIGLSEEAAQAAAERSRGTPRIANRLLRRLRDLAQVRGASEVSMATAIEGLQRLGIDDLGLEETDRKILGLLYRSGSRALGLKTIAAAIGESEDSVEEVYEPHLLRLELIHKTSRGRELTTQGRLLCSEKESTATASAQGSLFQENGGSN